MSGPAPPVQGPMPPDLLTARDPVIGLAGPAEMHRLVYISHARPPRSSAPVDPEVAPSIARRAAARNRAAGLTGVLIAIDETYIQILEGEPAQLAATFERICTDLRHSELRLIDYSPLAERRFGPWDMVFLDTATLDDSAPFAALLASVQSGIAPDALIERARSALHETQSDR